MNAVSKQNTLLTNSNWAVLEIAVFGLWNRVEIDVDHLVQVFGDNASDIVQFLMIKRTIRGPCIGDKHRQSD